MAIGRRAGDRLHADRAIGAGPVLDHDRLRPGLAKLLRQGAGDDVARATGLIGRDDRNAVRNPVRPRIYLFRAVFINMALAASSSATR